MAKRNVEGICRICGTFGPLSFEHVPPRAAFNDQPVVAIPAEVAVHLGPGERGQGTIIQRGAGDYTLCGKCNNDTGGWYGRHFAKWCEQGRDVLIRSEGRPRLIYLHYIYPLRIIKQIATMMFSVNGGDFRLKHPALVRFVLNKEARYLPPAYRFFTFYTTGAANRAVGTAGVLHIPTGRISVMSEITFPPFGYVMTFDSPPPDDRLYEITHFARYGYDDLVVAPLHLPVLPVHLAFPGDYRTKEQIDREYAEELAFERGLKSGVPLYLP